jgi:hypothetical protein
LHQVVAHGTDALRERRRPWEATDAGWLWLFLLHLDAKAGLDGAASLEFGTEPANEPRPFFGGAGGVEFHQAEEDVFGGEVRGPAVGFGDGTIKVVVEVAEDGDKAAVVNYLAGGVEGLAGAEFIEDVVHVGESQIGVRLLAALAMRIELLTEEADAFAQGLGGVGKGKSSKQRVLL